MPGRAIILFGHGSRDAQWRQPLDAVAARVRQLQPEVPVQCAFLELTEPDLASATASLAAQGAGTITIVPMFLGIGRHAREDLPRLVDELQAAHPTLRLQLQPAVGQNPALIDLLARVALGESP